MFFAFSQMKLALSHGNNREIPFVGVACVVIYSLCPCQLIACNHFAFVAKMLQPINIYIEDVNQFFKNILRGCPTVSLSQ